MSDDDTTSKTSSSVTSEGGAGDVTEDVAKRRNKNRVNARRSRERKRVALDTLQQMHWKLHQENKRVKVENDKIRQAIASIKGFQREKATPKPAHPANLLAGLLGGGGFPMQGLQQQPVVLAPPPRHPSGNPIIELLAQQLAMQDDFPNYGRKLKFPLPAQPAQAPAQPPPQAPQVDLFALLGRMSSDTNQQRSIPAAPMPATNSQADPNNVLHAALGTLISSANPQSAGSLALLLQGLLGNGDGMQ